MYWPACVFYYTPSDTITFFLFLVRGPHCTVHYGKNKNTVLHTSSFFSNITLYDWELNILFYKENKISIIITFVTYIFLKVIGYALATNLSRFSLIIHGKMVVIPLVYLLYLAVSAHSKWHIQLATDMLNQTEEFCSNIVSHSGY